MAQVVVVGGGFAGMSVAARLAKLRHDVTLVEASDQLGGRMRGITIDGATRQIELDTITLPAVFRDLFRKSGRPLESVLELEMTAGRRHVFKDKSILDLPLGNRGDQHAAVTKAFGEDEWSPWIDGLADTWDVLRRTALDQVFAGKSAIDRSVRKALRARRSISYVADRLPDERLAKMLLNPIRLAGQDRVATPGFAAVSHYVERNFGRWRFTGGLPALADALEARLAERKVTIALAESAHELIRDGDQVNGVVTDKRTLPAEVVLWCAPSWPAPLPAPRTMQVIPASRTLITLADDAPELPEEILVHANPPIRLFSGRKGEWTIEHRSGEDVLDALVRFGIDVRDHVTSRTDFTPSDLVRLGHWGWAWQGLSTAWELPGVAPSGGLYFAGAHAHPGGSLEAIGMATAAIAEDIGPASR
jgi:phytoene dehydrogenase-like protein